jgi:uncharacterized protein (TIGR03067 family)
MRTFLKRRITVVSIGLVTLFVAQSGFCYANRESRDDKKFQAKADKSLQGEWQVVEAEKNGKTSRGDDVKDMRMIFKGDELIVRSARDKRRERKSKFKVDPSKSPKQIDITSFDMKGKKVKTMACIYRVEEGKLKLCMPYTTKDPSKRPTKFKTRDKDGLMLLVLKRVAKEAE